MREDSKEIDLEILTDLHLLSPSEYEEVVSGMPSVCYDVFDSR
jgi:hypothetical protein